jgi:hypothetical protein
MLISGICFLVFKFQANRKQELVDKKNTMLTNKKSVIPKIYFHEKTENIDTNYKVAAIDMHV